jgi:flagellar motor switch protein FliM
MGEPAGDMLRQKVATGRGPAAVATLTPEKAWRLSFGRAGRTMQGLGLRLTGFGMERATVARMADLAPEAALVLTMMRAAGGSGALIVDPSMRNALVEVETMGRLAKGPQDLRPPTRIDALIVGAFFDSVMAAFDELAVDLSIADAVRGWRVGEIVGGAKVLPLVVEDLALRLFRMSFEFDEGARGGTALLALPMDAPKPLVSAAPGEAFSRDLEQVVLGAPAEVRAVLARLSLPLDAVMDWAPGLIVPLPRQALGQVRLEDIDNVSVARGRLGQMNGMRAVRLSPRIAEDE